MTVPEAVEQSLWDEPPFSAVLGYFAKQDTELGGQRIRQGDGLLFGIAPGNVDPVVRPDLAANMQGNRSHLAFGGGPHECPGQDIGRAIADVGVDALLMRLPDVELAVRRERAALARLDALPAPGGPARTSSSRGRRRTSCAAPPSARARPVRQARMAGRPLSAPSRRPRRPPDAAAAPGAAAAPPAPRPRSPRRPTPRSPGSACCAGGAATDQGPVSRLCPACRKRPSCRARQKVPAPPRTPPATPRTPTRPPAHAR